MLSTRTNERAKWKRIGSGNFDEIIINIYAGWLTGWYVQWEKKQKLHVFHFNRCQWIDTMLAHILLLLLLLLFLLFIICYIFGNFHINIRIQFCWSGCWSSWRASSASDRTRHHKHWLCYTLLCAKRIQFHLILSYSTQFIVCSWRLMYTWTVWLFAVASRINFFLFIII